MRLIDADALMQEYARFVAPSNNSDFADVPTWNDAVSLLGSAPTIEERKWIPCSKKMPEDLEEVNVTWVNHSPEPYYDFVKDKPFTATAVYYREKWYWYSSVCADILAESGTNYTDEIDSAIEITAWMPLPEPYKEGDT